MENQWENPDILKEREADNDAYAEECAIAEQDWKMEESLKWGREIFWCTNPNEALDLQKIRDMEALDSDTPDNEWYSILNTIDKTEGKEYLLNPEGDKVTNHSTLNKIADSEWEKIWSISENVTDVNESVEKETTIEEKNDAIKWNIYLPTIDLLFQNELITHLELNLLVEYLFVNKDSQEPLDLSKVEWLENNNVITEYIAKVNDADRCDTENDNAKDFMIDFDEYNIENNKFEWLEEAVFWIIWRNYIKIESWSLNSDQSKDASFISAIETSANKINGVENTVNKSSQTYINAIRNIYSWNIDSAIDWLTSLYTLIFSNVWINWTAMEKWKKALTKTLEKRLNKIQEKTEMIELQIKSWDLNKEKRKENNEELENLKVEEEEIKTGDIFKAWKIDKINDEVCESPSDNK